MNTFIHLRGQDFPVSSQEEQEIARAAMKAAGVNFMPVMTKVFDRLDFHGVLWVVPAAERTTADIKNAAFMSSIIFFKLYGTDVLLFRDLILQDNEFSCG